MDRFKTFEDALLTVNAGNASAIAMQLFEFQSAYNPLYRAFIAHSGVPHPKRLEEIPFLPISFFKHQLVKTGDWATATVFTSSGTTGNVTSRHAVKDPGFYRSHAARLFEHAFGPLTSYHVLALLPSYLEREGSSLVAMADHFIQCSQSAHSGFYLNNLEELIVKLEALRHSDKKVLLLGVTFALLDLAEKGPLDLSHCLVMETGGMKGRRKEITREELHRLLCDKFSIQYVLSEYGMTEMLSQAYSFGSGRFRLPAAIRVVIRDVNDPRQVETTGKTGGINLIDLANIHTCAFIETEDLGRINEDGSLEVLGRLDNSDIRGCNLLVG